MVVNILGMPLRIYARFFDRLRNCCLALVVVMSSLAWPSTATAHDVTFALYSKYEATTLGKEIAFVFALEKRSTLQLLELSLETAPIDKHELANHSEFFSQYLFDRLTVTNAGEPCVHPPALFHFAWDEATSRVLAVTKFSCENELTDLTIGSLVTHDMPSSHATMGDLLHGLALVRHAFMDDDTQTQIALAQLPQTHRTEPQSRPRRGRHGEVVVEA